MKLRGGDRTPTSTTGDSPNELRDFVASLFSDATLQESFADRLVFSVPQQSVPSLANCFLQLEKGENAFACFMEIKIYRVFMLRGYNS